MTEELKNIINHIVFCMDDNSEKEIVSLIEDFNVSDEDWQTVKDAVVEVYHDFYSE